jgi:hypothetical protein
MWRNTVSEPGKTKRADVSAYSESITCQLQVQMWRIMVSEPWIPKEAKKFAYYEVIIHTLEVPIRRN